MKTLVLIVAALLTAGHAAQAQKPAGPEIQAWFGGVVGRFSSAYTDAPNDMAKGLVRHDRAAALCATDSPIKTGHGLVKDWVGKVEGLDAVSDGRGILKVRIAQRIAVETTNNTFSEQFGGHQTLIAVGSPLYRAVVQLRVGQQVRFSGTFWGSKDDCAQEVSLTPEGAMEEPEFLFRFDAVQAVE